MNVLRAISDTDSHPQLYFKTSKLVLFKNRNILNEKKKSIDFSDMQILKNSRNDVGSVRENRKKREYHSWVFSVLIFFFVCHLNMLSFQHSLFSFSLILNESAIRHLDFDDTAPRKVLLFVFLLLCDVNWQHSATIFEKKIPIFTLGVSLLNCWTDTPTCHHRNSLFIKSV